MKKILQKASETGDVKVIKRLIALDKRKRKDFVLAEDDRWRNAFFVACRNGHLSIVSLLLNHGMNGNSRDDNQKTAFMYACEMGNDKIVKLLIKSKRGGNLDLDACDSDGRTALIICCQYGHLSTAKILTGYVLNVDARDKEGKNALIHSCSHDVAVAELLIDRDINEDVHDNGGQTPLIHACLCGNSDLVSLLIVLDACTVAQDKVGNTALIYAVKRGYEKCVDLLVGRGCPGSDIRGEGGKTALMHAVLLENMKIVKILLNYYSKVYIKDDDGMNVIMHACLNSSLKMMNILVEHSRDDYLPDTFWYEILVQCCKNGNFRIAKFFIIKHNISLDHFHEKEHPKQALMFACEAGQDKIVDLILGQGVNTNDYHRYGTTVYVNASDTFGRTALMYACINGHSKIVKSLLDHGAKVNICDKMGDSVLMYACRRGCDKIVCQLLKAGTNVNHCNQYGQNALMYASEFGSKKTPSLSSDANQTASIRAIAIKSQAKVVELLIQCNADFNAKSRSGFTAFLYACLNGCEKIADLMLRHKVDSTVRLPCRTSALDLALQQQHDKILSVLIRPGPELNDRDRTGRTGLIVACSFGNINAVKLLMAVENIDVNACDFDEKTALIHATMRGYDAIVALLAEMGSLNINARDCDKKSALIHASERGFDKIVRLLVFQDRIELNAVDDDNNTALIYACVNGHEGIAKLLMSRGAHCMCYESLLTYAHINGMKSIVNLIMTHISDVDNIGYDWQSALGYACKMNDEGAVRRLVDEESSACVSVDFRFGVDSMSPLLSSCKIGNNNIVNILLKCECDVNFSDLSCKTPLMYASEEGHAEIVALMIRIGADIGTRDDHNKTALMYALDGGHDELVSVLLCPGDDVDSLLGNVDTGETAMMYACRRKNVNLIEKLLDIFMNANANKQYIGIDARDENGKTALIYACDNGCHRIVSLLTNAGADVDVKDKSEGKAALMYLCDKDQDQHLLVACLIQGNKNMNIDAQDKIGKTALMYAIENGHKTTVRILIKQSTDLDVRDSNGKTALLHASKKGYDGVVGLLKRRAADLNMCDQLGKTALMYACQNGHLNVVKVLKRHSKLKINAQDNQGICALMYACEAGEERIVEQLIKDETVCIDRCDKLGQTCLIRACRRKHNRIVEILLAHGANTAVCDIGENTALCYASSSGNEKAVQLLGKALAQRSLSMRRDRGYKPIINACIAGFDNIVSMMIENGVSCNTKDSVEKSLLMHSCEQGHIKVVKALVRHDSINVDCHDLKGRTALMYACIGQQEEIVEVLLNYRANVNARDNEGRTALIYSCENGSSNIVRHLVRFVADVNIEDNLGRTAFWYCCPDWQINIIDWLLSPHYKCTNLDGAQEIISDPNDEDLEAIKDGLKIDIVFILIKNGLSVNAYPKCGLTLLMFSAKLDFWLDLKSALSKLLEHRNLDFDKADENGHTVFTYALKGRGDSMETLIESGKFVDNNGHLKAAHRNGANRNTNIEVTFDALYVALKNGFFDWNWCPRDAVKKIGLTALGKGFCPGSIDSVGKMSPIIAACTEKDVPALTFFLQNLYFFPEDCVPVYNSCTGDDGISFPKPLTLEVSSILSVSKAISLAGCPTQRSERVDALPLPGVLKSKLKFEGCDRESLHSLQKSYEHLFWEL